jgi:hypothetical protein
MSTLIRGLRMTAHLGADKRGEEWRLGFLSLLPDLQTTSQWVQGVIRQPSYRIAECEAKKHLATSIR